MPLMQPPPDMCTNRVRADGLWSQGGSHSHTLGLYGLSETAGSNNFQQQVWPLLLTDPAAGATTQSHCLPPVRCIMQG